jgi:hypothetical protein
VRLAISTDGTPVVTSAELSALKLNRLGFEQDRVITSACSAEVLAGPAAGVATFQPPPCERFEADAGAVETLRSSQGKDLRPSSASVSSAAPAFQGV